MSRLLSGTAGILSFVCDFLIFVLFYELSIANKTSLATLAGPINGIEQSKKLAAYHAVDNHVLPEHRVIGFPLAIYSREDVYDFFFLLGRSSELVRVSPKWVGADNPMLSSSIRG